jgi:DNA-binding GntR family transcriptional regulator
VTIPDTDFVSITTAEAPAAPPVDPASERRRLAPVQPRTMVEQAAEAVVAAAARGAFLPGDRLVEAEIARDLGISRVPVREALRLLESQGVVVSTPYKGMRLMQVTNRTVAELMHVRGALEALALRDVLAGGTVSAARLTTLHVAAMQYEAAASGDDQTAALALDEVFHAELCRLAGNMVLHGLWLGLARQLTVIWGLGHGARSKPRVAEEHHEIVRRMTSGDLPGALAALHDHLAWHEGFDFEDVVAARRSGRKR